MRTMQWNDLDFAVGEENVINLNLQCLLFFGSTYRTCIHGKNHRHFHFQLLLVCM